MTRVTALSLIPVLLLLSGSAAAQGRGFAVEGTVVVGDDSRDSRLPGQILGGGVNVLGSLSPRISLGLETDLPNTRGYDLTFHTAQPDGSGTVLLQHWTFRGVLTAGVISVHFAIGRRLNVSLVTGFGLESRHFGEGVSRDTLDSSGAVIAHEVVTSPLAGTVSEWPQVPLGVDLALALGSHLSLVPEFRWYFDPLAPLNDGCCDGPQMRGRVALRWRF